MGYLANMIQEAKVCVPTHGAKDITYVQNHVSKRILTVAS
jgi:hypothetical protein